MLKILFALLPVIIYLAALVVLDSYKLVKLRSVVLAVVMGGLALLVCHQLNTFLFDNLQVSFDAFRRYVAPFTEEVVKSLYLIYLVRSRRIGFMVDAAIFGFAVGAGFGIVENMFYLQAMPDSNLFVWVLRGCGTALMHGTTTAVFGIVSHTRWERGGKRRLSNFLPGLGLAILIHSAFNHFFITPVMTAVTLVVGVPLVTIAVYSQSERTLEGWLNLGFDTDAEMLAIINEGKVSQTRVGRYLMSLRARFAPEVVADMYCLLRIQTELAIQAKGLLLTRKEGFKIPPAPGVQEKLDEEDRLRWQAYEADHLARLGTEARPHRIRYKPIAR